MTDLSPLIERVCAATGPDRELDAAIIAWLNNAEVRPYPPSDDFGPRDRWQFWSLDGAHFLGSESKFPVPALSASLDAALTLVERTIPGAGWRVEKHGGALPEGCRYWATAGKIGEQEQAFAATGPLALILALLRALQAQQEGGEDV